MVDYGPDSLSAVRQKDCERRKLCERGKFRLMMIDTELFARINALSMDSDLNYINKEIYITLIKI